MTYPPASFGSEFPGTGGSGGISIVGLMLGLQKAAGGWFGRTNRGVATIHRLCASYVAVWPVEVGMGSGCSVVVRSSVYWGFVLGFEQNVFPGFCSFPHFLLFGFCLLFALFAPVIIIYNSKLKPNSIMK